MAKGKYHARKVTLFGETFDSQLEANQYLVLLERCQNGEIEQLELHPEFQIIPKWKNPHTGKTERAKKYTADFRYREGEKVVVEEVKSRATKKARDFSLRFHLVQMQNPDIEFRLVMDG